MRKAEIKPAERASPTQGSEEAEFLSLSIADDVPKTSCRQQVMARKKTLSDRSYSVRPSTDQIDPCGALLEELIVLLARIAAREMQADPHLNVAAGKSSF